MKIRHILVPALLMLAACSETPIEEQGEEAIAEQEIQIQEEEQFIQLLVETA